MAVGRRHHWNASREQSTAHFVGASARGNCGSRDRRPSFPVYHSAKHARSICGPARKVLTFHAPIKTHLDGLLVSQDLSQILRTFLSCKPYRLVSCRFVSLRFVSLRFDSRGGAIRFVIRFVDLGERTT